VPLDLHRCFDGADPLAALISNLDDTIAGIAPSQTACADLGCRAGGRLHGSAQAIELGAVVIAHALCAIVKVDVVAGQGDLVWASTPASDMVRTKR